MNKSNFYDTSALLNGALPRDIDYISIQVLQELDKIKVSNTKEEDIKERARTLVRWFKEHPLKVVKTNEKEARKVYRKYPWLLQNADTKILIDAIVLGGMISKEVRFLTSDISFFLMARECDEVEVKFFCGDGTVPAASIYTGIRNYSLDVEQIKKIYDAPEVNSLAAKTNEYCILIVDNRIEDTIRWNGKSYEPVEYKTLRSRLWGEVKPLNPEQKCMFDLLQNREMKIKLVLGNYGSGKTFISLVHAIDLIQRGDFDKLVFLRNNIQVKDTVDIGSLPGNEIEKIFPFILPLADHLGGIEQLYDSIDRGVIEPAHLGFIRGRDLKRTILYVDECENLTRQQIQLLIGRIGEGSELWLMGDLRQTDKQVFDRNSGVRSLVDKVAGQTRFGLVKLIKSERSDVAAMADLLD